MLYSNDLIILDHTDSYQELHPHSSFSSIQVMNGSLKITNHNRFLLFLSFGGQNILLIGSITVLFYTACYYQLFAITIRLSVHRF